MTLNSLAIFLPLLIFHVIGDFYLQTHAMSVKKRGNVRNTLKHSMLYAVPFLFLFILYRNILSVFILSVLIHMIIDLLKIQVERNRSKRFMKYVTERNSYILDQLLHMLTLILAAGLFHEDAVFRFGAELSFLLYMRWLLAVLLIFKPANITFKMMFGRFSPKEEKPVSIQGAGAVIGSLERILMLIFLALGQYASIGLIMTAKSIARYDKISKDPVFAEYYLIGTLFSIMTTLTVYFITFDFIVFYRG